LNGQKEKLLLSIQVRRGDTVHGNTTIRRSFTTEFKEGAVRLGEARGFMQAGRDLGVGANQIRRWRKLMAGNVARPFPGKGNAKDEELAALRKKRNHAVNYLRFRPF
jgi:transposase